MQKANLAAILTLFLTLLLSACAPQPMVHELRGQAWGTTYRIKIVADEDRFDEEQVRAALRRTLVDIDDRLSNWNPKSEVSRFNANTNPEPVKLSPPFNDLMQVADRVHRSSDGFFDLTLAPVIEIWGFGSSGREDGAAPTPPDDAAIAAAMTLVGQRSVLDYDHARSQLQKRKSDATVFLSALAKGAGIDAIKDALAGLGLDNCLIEVGGDLIAIGEGPSGAGWQIGIEQPRMGAPQSGEIIGLSNLAMATSGDYRNYFEEDGVRFSHIIDPQTGRPITHKTASVTVLSEDAALADAWATALLAAGEERGLKIAERENIAALFISRSQTNDRAEFESANSSAFERVRNKP
ncbi:MAG: FAD:protein FMN transferase [Pseudomonadota bacterium]